MIARILPMDLVADLCSLRFVIEWKLAAGRGGCAGGSFSAESDAAGQQ